jgi:hypothetical protein
MLYSLDVMGLDKNTTIAVRKTAKELAGAHFDWLKERSLPVPTMTDFATAAIGSLVKIQQMSFRGHRKKQ